MLNRRKAENRGPIDDLPVPWIGSGATIAAHENRYLQCEQHRRALTQPAGREESYMTGLAVGSSGERR